MLTEEENMGNKEEKKYQNYLTHSLTGNTSGNNTTQTVVNILNQTTVRPSSQSAKPNENQSKEAGE